VATPLQVDSFDQFAGASTNGRIWLGDATFQWFHTWRDITIPTGVYFTEFGDDDHVWTDVRSMAELRYEPKLSESATLLSRVYFNRYYYAGLLPYVGYDSLEEYLGLSAGGEVRLVVEAGDPFRVTVGGLAEVSPTVTLTGVDQDAQGDPLDAPYLDADFPYQVAAGYALVDIVPIDEIRLTAGGRVDFWSATESLAVSPRLALVMVPDEGDFVKLLFGRAFRAPSIYEVAYDTPFQAAPELGTLEPETVWSGELEYSHAFDASWTGLVAAHGSLAQNIVETVGIGDVDITDPKYDPTAVTYINSEDPIRILGGDAELRRGFQGGWMMSGFYSFLDSRYVSDELENTLVPNVPQHSAGLKVIVPVSQPIARVAFRSALEAPRRISLARGNTTDWAVVADVVLSGTVPERGFDYAVGVYNLFNQAYSLPSGDTFPTATLPQQGRSFMANLSLRL
jgi:hypothetical protein